MAPVTKKRAADRVSSAEDSVSDAAVSDAALVARAVQDDVEAFEELVGRYQQSVFNIAYYKSRNCFDAEDLSQDIFLAAFRALTTLKEPQNFSNWLFGIAYNRCHKWYHRERNKIVKIQEVRRRLEQEGRIHRREPGSSLAEEKPPIADFLKRLPDEIRSVLTLKYLEGLSYDEIEKRLDIKPQRIDYLIRKGKKALRSHWENTRKTQG